MVQPNRLAKEIEKLVEAGFHEAVAKKTLYGTQVTAGQYTFALPNNYPFTPPIQVYIDGTPVLQHMTEVHGMDDTEGIDFIANYEKDGKNALKYLYRPDAWALSIFLVDAVIALESISSLTKAASR